MRFFFYGFLKSIVQFSGMNFVENNMVLQCQKVRHIGEGFRLYPTEIRKHYSAWESFHVLKANASLEDLRVS